MIVGMSTLGRRMEEYAAERLLWMCVYYHCILEHILWGMSVGLCVCIFLSMCGCVSVFVSL